MRGTKMELKVHETAMRKLNKKGKNTQWQKDKKTKIKQKTRHLGTYALPEYTKTDTTRCTQHAISRVMNRLRTGFNNWRGHPPNYPRYTHSMTKQQRERVKATAKCKQQCDCAGNHVMTAEHLFERCKLPLVVTARRKLIQATKKIFKNENETPTLQWCLQESTWRSVTKEEKPTQEQKQDFAKRVYDFTKEISPVTGWP